LHSLIDFTCKELGENGETNKMCIVITYYKGKCLIGNTTLFRF